MTYKIKTCFTKSQPHPSILIKHNKKKSNYIIKLFIQSYNIRVVILIYPNKDTWQVGRPLEQQIHQLQIKRSPPASSLVLEIIPRTRKRG